jgi:hypothetical protein
MKATVFCSKTNDSHPFLVYVPNGKVRGYEGRITMRPYSLIDMIDDLEKKWVTIWKNIL